MPNKPPSVNYQRTVEKLSLKAQRSTDEQHGRKALALLDHPRQGGFGGVEQNVLVKKILIGVSRNSKLGKKRNGRACIRGTPGEAERPLGIEVRISYAHVRNADRRSNKSMRINRMKGAPRHDAER